MFRREREAAGAPARTASPVPPARNDDGFEPVPEKKVWKPKRLQGKA
jgi:translation initiation factor 3 subunit A